MVKFILIFSFLCYSAQATTYYVADSNNTDVTSSWGASAASDGNTGLSWAASWSTIRKINATLTFGDTVYFSTGIFRDTTLNIISGNGSGDRTAYACSSFAAVNGSGQYHFAQLWGSDSLTNWVQESGSVYRAEWGISGIGYPILYQDDSIILGQTSLANVDAAGKWFYRNDSVFAWVYGGDDPDNYDMEIAGGRGNATGSASSIVNFGGAADTAADYVTLYGLAFRYGWRKLLDLNDDGATKDQDSVFIDHCFLSHVAGDHGVNPGLIYTGASLSTKGGHYNRVRSCSLSYAWALSSTPLPQVISGNKGSGFDFYHQSYMTVDSNAFYGYFKQAGFYRKAGFTSSQSDSNTIAFNTFKDIVDGDGINLFGPGWGAMIYGNIFQNISQGEAIRVRFSPWNQSGLTMIYNNTFIDCKYPLKNRTSADGNVPFDSNEFKYNVVYASANDTISITDYGSAGDEYTDIDSNMYYNSAGSQVFRLPEATTKTEEEWQALGPDANSTFATDPVFDNYGADDFARSAAGTEMTRTYGYTQFGVTAFSPTIFGALQNAEAEAATRYKMKGYK